MDLLIGGAGELGLTLSAEQIQGFRLYYQLLCAWNRRVNLTAITEAEEVQRRHFLDALTVLAVLDGGQSPSQEPLRLLDLGTGAGFPGVPLKIVRPELRLTLLEATAKKTRFLAALVEALRLEGVEVLTGRAEELAHHPRYREAYDVVVGRGVAKLPTLVELALPFCREGGRLIAQKKGSLTAEIQNATMALNLLGGRLVEVRPVALQDLPDGRSLLIIEKIAPTPETYPRRSGIPFRRPLGQGQP